MSDVYCRTCDENDEDIKHAIDNINSPACLTNVTVKRKPVNTVNYQPQHPSSILTVESELEYLNTKMKLQTCANILKANGGDSSKQEQLKSNSHNCSDNKNNNNISNKTNGVADTAAGVEYEIADDATIFNSDLEDNLNRMNILTDLDNKLIIHGKEELPAKEQTTTIEIHDQHRENASNALNIPYHSKNTLNKGALLLLQNAVNNGDTIDKARILKTRSNTLPASVNKKASIKVNCTNNHPLLESKTSSLTDDEFISDNLVDNGDDDDAKHRHNKSAIRKMKRLYSTLPRTRKSILDQMSVCHKRTMKHLPTRITPDGTTIFYWCDLSKQAIKGYYTDSN